MKTYPVSLTLGSTRVGAPLVVTTLALPIILRANTQKHLRKYLPRLRVRNKKVHPPVLTTLAAQVLRASIEEHMLSLRGVGVKRVKNMFRLAVTTLAAQIILRTSP